MAEQASPAIMEIFPIMHDWCQEIEKKIPFGKEILLLK